MEDQTPVNPALSTNSLGDEFIQSLADLEVIPDPYAWVTWCIVALSLLALAGLIFAIILHQKKRQARQPSIRLLPHEVALQRLQKALDLQTQPKAFVIEVSDTLRQYLEDRFHIAAPEQTTEEFLATIQNDPQFEVSHKRVLDDFMHTADLVKFAKFEPGRQALIGLFDNASRLVTQTASTVQLHSGESISHHPGGPKS